MISRVMIFHNDDHPENGLREEDLMRRSINRKKSSPAAMAGLSTQFNVDILVRHAAGACVLAGLGNMFE
jgi:hypothetical protein